MSLFNGKQRHRTLVIALGLITYAAILHFRLISVLPDPLMEPDSLGYLAPSLDALSGEPLQFSASRGYGYPLFLVGVLKVFQHLSAILWGQHALALMTGILAAVLFFRHVRKSVYFSLAVFVIVSCSPRSVFYAHEILTEGLFSFVQVCGLLIILEMRSRDSWRWSSVAGFLIVLAMTIRPSGQALFLGLGLSLFWEWRDARIRRSILKTVGVCVLGMFTVVSINRVHRGFWNFEQMGGVHLLGPLFQHLNVEKIKDVQLRETLRPFYKPPYLSHLQDPDWVRYAPDGPISRLQRDPHFSANIDTLLKQLSVMAFCEAPITIMVNDAKIGIAFILWGAELPPDDLMDKRIGVRNSIAQFLQSTESRPALRRLLSFQPQDSPRYFATVDQTAIFPFERGTLIDWPAWGLRLFYPFLPWLGILAMAVLFFAAHGRSILSIFAPVLFIQVAMIAIGGLYAWRYSAPFEPLYAILTVGGLSVFSRCRDKA